MLEALCVCRCTMRKSRSLRVAGSYRGRWAGLWDGRAVVRAAGARPINAGVRGCAAWSVRCRQGGPKKRGGGGLRAAGLSKTNGQLVGAGGVLGSAVVSSGEERAEGQVLGQGNTIAGYCNLAGGGRGRRCNKVNLSNHRGTALLNVWCSGANVNVGAGGRVCVVCFACVICNGGAGGRLAISLYCVWWGCVGVVDNIYYYYCELVSNYNYIDTTHARGVAHRKYYIHGGSNNNRQYR